MTQSAAATGAQSGRLRIADVRQHGTDVKVWLVKHAQHPGLASMGWLDEGERARASNYMRDDDRAAFVVTRAALRRVLSSEVGIPPSEWTFSISAFGKPEITNRRGCPDVSFSVSHTEGLSLIVVARGRSVGVDVERHRPVADMETVAAKAFNEQVAARLRKLPILEGTTAFLRCWTVGEALGKATGLGIVGLGGKFPVALAGDSTEPCIKEQLPAQASRQWGIAPLDVGSGYIATVVYEQIAGVSPRVRLLEEIPAASQSHPA